MKRRSAIPRILLGKSSPYMLAVATSVEGVLHRQLAELGDDIVVRKIDGENARSLEELARQLKQQLGGPGSASLDAFSDVMTDPDWVCIPRSRRPAVFVVRNAGDLLRDVAGGFALWGTLAENWSRYWAEHAALGLHFIHISRWYPKDAPAMHVLELEAAA